VCPQCARFPLTGTKTLAIPESFATVLPSLFGAHHAHPPKLNNAALQTKLRSVLMPDQHTQFCTRAAQLDFPAEESFASVCNRGREFA